MSYGFQKLLSDILEIDRAEQVANQRHAQADMRAAARSIRRSGKDLAKSMAPHMADMERIGREQRRMIKSIKADAAAHRKAQEAARPVLGALIKSAVDDAVRNGRISGTAAQAGLRALGLDRHDAKMQMVADAVHRMPAPDNGKVRLASLAGMSPERQRAAVDHLVRTGKLSGVEAMKVLEELKRHRAG